MRQPTLSERSDRDSRRYFETQLRVAGREINGLLARVRSLRRDLAEDFIDERDTSEAREQLQGALEHLAHAVTQIDEARRRLP